MNTANICVGVLLLVHANMDVMKLIAAFFATVVTNLQGWVTHENNECQNKMYHYKSLNSAALPVTWIDWALNWSPHTLACKSERRGWIGVVSDLGIQVRMTWSWSKGSWPLKIGPIGAPKRRQEIATLRCAMTQKIAFLCQCLTLKINKVIFVLINC